MSTTHIPFPERDADELLTLSEVAEILKAPVNTLAGGASSAPPGVPQDRPPPRHHGRGCAADHP